MSEPAQEQELRIVLDGSATKAFKAMVERMKADTATIRIQPSHFVSFLVADYLEAHFQKDMRVLIAEFFDSDSYYEAARRKAKGALNYEEQMAKALDEALKIKANRRRAPVKKRKHLVKSSEGKLNETI